MMTRCKHWVLLICLAGVSIAATGCRYMTNRYYDFRDTFALGVGWTAQNSFTGIWPPSLGVYVEATDFLHLGAITHNGWTAEVDMRGSGVYMENRTRLGLLCWQAYHDEQDYTDAFYKNYFKTPGNKWEAWMRGPIVSGQLPAPDGAREAAAGLCGADARRAELGACQR